MAAAGTDPLEIRLGLISSGGKYLTAESFGFTVNASASSMKRKQIWTLEQADGGAVKARRAWSSTVTWDATWRPTSLRQRDPRTARARVGGRFSSAARRRWELVSCGPAPRPLPGRDRGPHLVLRAERLAGREVDRALRHAPAAWRRRFVHLWRGEKLADGEDLPWGWTPARFVFLERRYHLQTADNRFLSNGSSWSDHSANRGLQLEFRAGKVVFRDSAGRYLSPAGPTGTLRAGKSARVGKDELFVLERSHAQVLLRASNDRNVSMRQGVDLSANQDEESDQEVFQLEMSKEEAGLCAFRTVRGTYWNHTHSGQLQSNASLKSASCFFHLEWEGSKVTLKASNGKYINARKNGQLSASADTPGESEQFTVRLINRPLIVLRGEHGFIGARKADSATLDSNRASCDVYQLQHKGGAYSLKGEKALAGTREGRGFADSGP
ncbi:hypothetical protein AALO_G00089780 [Alosa alosa]|uniref:Fascin n=1 Tax=Alosa alosa TaxID=278164 RepID=A0AAV6GVI9_9TELE|nr:hypothetical protein AALO_G00089780 [Alosa alosa]